jgi:hypothetical protein
MKRMRKWFLTFTQLLFFAALFSLHFEASRKLAAELTHPISEVHLKLDELLQVQSQLFEKVTALDPEVFKSVVYTGLKTRLQVRSRLKISMQRGYMASDFHSQLLCSASRRTCVCSSMWILARCRPITGSRCWSAPVR